MDSIKFGLVIIGLISMTVVIGGIIINSTEVITAGAAGSALIGGWLGHATLSGKDPGTSPPDKTVQ